jgi:hypothetical protein
VDAHTKRADPSPKYPEGKTEFPWQQITFGLEKGLPGPIQTCFRVGKKAAGRLLDGREWNEYPGSNPTETTHA